ncbi:MAG: DUF6268 family outer membrane beta-barrel protein [Candidatus Omnitrophota bacterium]
MNKKIRFSYVLFILIFVLSAHLRNSYAQDDAKAVPGASSGYRQELGKTIVVKEEYLPLELDTYARYMGLGGAGGQSGKVGIIDSAAEYSYEVKAFGKLPVQFGVASRYIGIKNTTRVELPAYLTSAGFGVEATFPFFNIDKTYFNIGIAPSFFSDNWNFNSLTFSLLQRYFLIYQPNEKWVFICGAEYSPRFKDPVSPILGFIYKPNERLTFSIIPDSPEISYLLNDKTSVFIQGSSTSNEYRVKKDGLKNVVLNYDEMHLGAGLRRKWNKHVTGSFTAGGVFNRSIEYRQDSLGKVTIDNGFFVELRLVMAI